MLGLLLYGLPGYISPDYRNLRFPGQSPEAAEDCQQAYRHQLPSSGSRNLRSLADIYGMEFIWREP